MIIWSGLGPFAPILFAFVAFFGATLTETALGELYHAYPLIIVDAPSLVAATFASTWLGLKMRGWGRRTVVDKQTGVEMEIGGNHSVFFIPAHYWGGILAVAAVFVLIKSSP